MIDQTLKHEFICESLPPLLLVGIDEAGRGPLAGPVTAAAVALPLGYLNSEVADSKKLSEIKRENLFESLKGHVLASAVISLGPREIEAKNIRQATRIAMAAAAAEVLKMAQRVRPDIKCHFMIDGNVPMLCNLDQETVVKGDQKIVCISAASIFAKVTRDREMLELDRQYPGYGLAAHKGYPTKYHREQIASLGPTIIHRRTFAGVREHLNQS